VLYSGGEAQPSFSGKHGDASARGELSWDALEDVASVRREKIIILSLFLSTGL